MPELDEEPDEGLLFAHPSRYMHRAMRSALEVVPLSLVLTYEDLRDNELSREDIRFEKPMALKAIHVGAPGYEWVHREVGRWNGKPLEVILRPAGSVTLEVTGHPPEGLTGRIRIRRTDADANLGPTASYPLVPGTLACAGLAAGTYVARAEIGDPFDRDPFVLGSVSFDIGAGMTHSMRLDITPFERPRDVTLHGTLRIPPAWDIQAPRLRFHPVQPDLTDRPEPRFAASGEVPAHRRLVSTGADTWSFRGAPVQAGRYVAHVPGADFLLPVRIDGSAVRIELPQPTRVRIRLTGDGADRVRTVECVLVGHHHRVLGPNHWWAHRRDLTRSEADEPFEFQSTPGARLKLWIKGIDDRVGFGDFEVGDPSTELVLSVWQPADIEIALRCNGQPVRWHWHWFYRDPKLLRFVAPDGTEGEWLGAFGYEDSPDCLVVRWQVVPAGAYDLRVAPIPGYVQHEPAPVELVAGERTRVTVELRRR